MADDDIPIQIEAIFDITMIKAAVITSLIGIYREQGREVLEDTLAKMHEHPDVSNGIVPIAAELVIALSACAAERGV